MTNFIIIDLPNMLEYLKSFIVQIETKYLDYLNCI